MKNFHQILSDRFDKQVWPMHEGKILIEPGHLKESMLNLAKMAERPKPGKSNGYLLIVVLLLALITAGFTLRAQQPKYHAGTPFVIKQDTINVGKDTVVIQLYRVGGSLDTLCRIVKNPLKIKP